MTVPRIVTGRAGVRGGGPYFVLEGAWEEFVLAALRCSCNGCRTAVSLCDHVSLLLKGRTLAQVESLEERDLRVLFPDVPEGKGHYIPLLHSAIKSLVEEAKRS